jgi:proline-specific peptidase
VRFIVRFILAFAFLSATACRMTAPDRQTDQLWSALTPLCGKAFAGRVTEGTEPSDAAIAAEPLVMHVRSCSEAEIRIPFHVGANRSRTWVITRTSNGLRLKHDHRHEDGTPDRVTQYGGDTRGNHDQLIVDFYADEHTAALIPAARTNIWTLAIEPGKTFAYALRREESGRRFRVEFDLTKSIPPPAAAQPRVREGFVRTADGVRLFYRQVGERTGSDLVVYVHGGPGSNFRGNGTEMDGLARGRTLVMYDQRGSGRSDIISDPRRLTAGDHVRDLDTVRRHFGARRMALIGLSWGAGLALLYTAEHPDNVSRLLLVSPMPLTRGYLTERLEHLAKVMGPEAAARVRWIREELPNADDSTTHALCREASELTFRAYLLHATPEALAKAAMRCDIAAAAIRNRPVVERATFASLGDWDFRPVAKRVRVPALVLEGAETTVPLERTREWAAALPNARMTLLPRAGHELFLDQPRLFLEAADAFLRAR